MTSDTAVIGPAEGRTSDERWAAWVAKSATHDRKARTRAIAFGTALAAAIAAWLAIAVVVG